MAVANPLLDEFAGGQMTDLPAYPGGADPTALFEIVSPGTSANGVNYAINALQLAAFLGGAGYSTPTIILSGSSYNSVASDTRILVDKTIGSATTINLLGATSYSQPVLIKDMKGDADSNNITVVFSGTYDGVSSPLTISTQYGWIWFNPLPNGNWYGA